MTTSSQISDSAKELSRKGGNADICFEASPSFLRVLPLGQAQLESTNNQKFQINMVGDIKLQPSLCFLGVLNTETLHHTAEARSVLESDYRIETCLQHFLYRDTLEWP